MVSVYTSPTCGFCHMAMQYLKSKGVDFTERDISSDHEALEFVANTIGQLATPVIDIDGDIILGFDRERIDVSLRRKKLI
jgi:glutaredoxin-like YruB-family protein